MPIVGEDPEFVRWDDLVKDLRTGDYDDPGHPAGRAFLRVRLMGKAAWPCLVRYIDCEDILIGKAVVTALNKLTGRQEPLPTEATKARCRAEWESWIGRQGPGEEPGASLEVVRMMVSRKTEAEVRLLLADLADEHDETRSKAQEEFQECALRYAELIRRTYDRTGDPEVRYRLGPLVQGLPHWQAEESQIRANPDLLLETLRRLPEGTPVELRRRIEALHDDLNN